MIFPLGKKKKHIYRQVLVYLTRVRNAGFHTFIDYVECLLYLIILLVSIHRMAGQEHFSNRPVILKTRSCECIPVPWEHVKCVLALIWKWETLKKDTVTSLRKFNFWEPKDWQCNTFLIRCARKRIMWEKGHSLSFQEGKLWQKINYLIEPKWPWSAFCFELHGGILQQLLPWSFPLKESQSWVPNYGNSSC